jgi:acyl-CoA reductase-like NAD-dependent aldehyde dehydrogenase
MVFMNEKKAPDDLSIVPLWINGSAQPIEKEELFPVVSSIQDKPIHYAVSASPESAVSAVESASKAFASWRKTSAPHRRNLLLKTADILERRAKEIMDYQMTETSCPKEFAGFNIKAGTIYVREIAAATSELRGTVPQRMSDDAGNEVGGLTVVVREPVGVVLIIPP